MRAQVFGAVVLVALVAGCIAPSKTRTAQQQTVYKRPLTSPGAKFGALPPAVQRTVLAQVGPAQVVDAVRDTSSGRVVYKIYFLDSKNFPTMYVAPDGSLLNPDLTVAISAVQGNRVKPSEVPASVTKAISTHASGGEVAHVNKESWGGKVVYVVTFKDEAHFPKLLVGEDGAVVEETQ